MSLGEDKYYVQILGDANSEKILLEESLLIGSEVASGLQVSHPHLSAEHCSVSLQSGVLSIIDLNSDLGVLVNGKKIPPNKMIIILPTDDIKIGDLILKIHVFEEMAISTDQTTKILSLDDLIVEDAKHETQAYVLPEEAPDTTQENATISDLNIKLQEKASSEVEEVPLKMTSNDSTHNQNSEVKAETPSVETPKTDPTVASPTTSKVDLLAKYKRNGKKTDPVHSSKQNLKNFKSKSKRYYFAQFNSVSFPLRIFGFILDMILGLRLSLFLIEKDAMEFFSPIIEFVNFSFDFVFNLHPDTAYLASHAISFSSYFVGYLLLRIAGNFILGLSPGQFLIGCWNEGHFIAKRLLGPVREILGFVLAPLLVFDLPALFSKKTVKEMLTMTGLECYNKTLSYVLALTLIPITFLVAFFSPLYLQDFPAGEFTFVADSQKISIPESLSSEKTVTSNFYRLDTSWHNKLYFSYLNFKQANAKDQSKVYVPRITLVSIDQEAKLLVRMERKKEFQWNDQISQIIKMYPVLSNRFEQFKNLDLENSKEYSSQLKQIIMDSFQLNQENLISFILNYGPYIDPFLNFKRTLNRYFQGEVDSIEFWKNSEVEFMIVSTKNADVAGRWREIYIVPLTQNKTYIYQFSYLKDTLPKTKILIKNFLSLAKVQNKVNANMKEWKGSELTSPELLDFYSLKSVGEKDKAAMSPFIHSYYWNIAKIAAVTNFELFWADYSNNLRTAVGMLSEMNREARKTANPENDPLSDVGYDLLIKKLSFMRESVKNKDTTYFQVIKYP